MPAIPHAMRRLVPTSLRGILHDLAVRWLMDDAESVAVFHRAARGEAGGDLRLSALRPHPFHVRAHRTDAAAVFNNFWHRWQLPPEPPRTIVDLGANIGATTDLFAVTYPEAHIWAVEMDAENVAMLRRNSAPWANRVTVRHAAVWPTTGEIVSYAGSRPDNLRIGPTGQRVTTLSLTTLLNEIGPVDYLRMDIEGTEAIVLKEGTDWAVDVRVLNVDVHPPYMPQDATADLQRLGFRVRPSAIFPLALTARR